MDEERITSMLFSDLKGYSKIKNDDLIVRLASQFTDEIANHILRPSNHFFYNTWGDAFFICSDNPTALAEIALQIRDKARHADWQRLGFNESIAIRVGLHAQNVRVLKGLDGKIANVIGKGVNAASRIEPITEPNEVFCSRVFHELLLHESPSNIQGIPIGRKMLAKNFGEAELYRLVWSNELSGKPSEIGIYPPIPMPNLKGGVTDKQRADFLPIAFDLIKTYFGRALNQLSSTHSNIDSSLRPITNVKFVSEIYRDGKTARVCKIWMNISGTLGNSIYYSDTQSSLDSDQTFNEALRVEDDGVQIYLNRFPGLALDLSFRVKDKLTSEEAAEYLWKRFTLPLESKLGSY